MGMQKDYNSRECFSSKLAPDALRRILDRVEENLVFRRVIADQRRIVRELDDSLSPFGNVHTPLLAYGTKEQIEEKVREYCMTVAPGGGYVLGSSTSIMDGIPPENFETMVRSVHKYGRYGCLGQAN